MFSKTALVIACMIAQTAFAFDHTHSKWNEVVKSHVVAAPGPTSQFKYLELMKKTQPLDQYLAEVSAVPEAEYNKWTQNQKLAFLFNAYNAFTVKLIASELAKKPDLKSIKEIGSLFKNAWKIKFFQFLGQDSYLDRLEQELARPKFDEPRLHMAFNCASIGCPPLRNEAFVADKLEGQLDNSTREFLADKSRNYYDEKKKTLFISMIFKWYKKDFEESKTRGPLRRFLAEHMVLAPEVKKSVLDGSIAIEHTEYDWNLNIAK